MFFLGARTQKVHTSAVGYNYLTNYCEMYYQASNINTEAREPLHITYPYVTVHAADEK